MQFEKSFQHFVDSRGREGAKAIVVEVEVADSTEEMFNQWYGFVESRIRRLIPLLESKEGVKTHLFPKSFTPVHYVGERS